jgi:hypothetical protein
VTPVVALPPCALLPCLTVPAVLHSGEQVVVKVQRLGLRQLPPPPVP